MKVLLTPEMAKELLKKNTLNRPIRREALAEYTGKIRRGEWKYNGETIKISENGVLLDGQHRCMAVVKADAPIWVEIIEGLPEDIFRSVDIGRGRTTNDGLSILGFKNVNHTAAAARNLMAYESAENLSAFRFTSKNTKFSLEEVEKYLYENEKEINDVIKKITKSMVTRRCGSSSAFVAAVVACYKANPEYGEMFIEKIKGGSFDKKDPVFQLKEKLIFKNYATKKGGYDLKTEIFALTIKAFNYYIMGKSVKTFSWRATGETREPMPIPMEGYNG